MFRFPCRFAVATALSLIIGALAPPADAQDPPEGLPSIEDKTAGMQPLGGFIDMHWDEATGRLYLEIDRWDEEFLYQLSLASGLGSNPVGLDRGQLGRTLILKPVRVGPKVLLVEPNYRYRARSENRAEVEAVKDAFAPSTHWGFAVAAQTGERVLVDATDFFLRDAHGVIGTLQQSGQGTFRLEPSRSIFHLPRTKGFPENTEVEVSLTFTSDRPGRLVQNTAASGDAVTLRQHHSFVRLPDDGYTPREADPRIGSFGITFADYATPIDAPLEQHWIARHRLQKQAPGEAPSRPVEPIVYYVDRGTPEPIQTALIEGASWWNEAFEAAGFIDAFRVERLPEDVDPQDVRYNMIHWTHRSTRGWSYGSTILDPRTGEIIKGNVNLGSLRLRQDYLLGQGLVSPFAAQSTCDICAGPSFDYLPTVANGADPVAMALARVRQLSAHEVGHTLGFAHNYIASTHDRASVMDYPAPLVGIVNGEIDLSDAYDVGIGEYDKLAVQWAYGEFAPGVDADAAREEIIQDGLARGIRFLSDQDARPAGGAHPLAALWDNGADPIAMLRHEIEVRRIAMNRFGEASVRPGEPLAGLEEVLVPLYLHHRYQVEAAIKSIGGVDYAYALRGDGQTPISTVTPERQREALTVVLSTLGPDFLAVPERVLRAIPPRAYGMSRGEILETGTSPTFDPIGAAAGAADLVLGFILQPQRMARLVEFHSRDQPSPGLEEVLDRLIDATWKATPSQSGYHRQIQHVVAQTTLGRLLREAAAPSNAPGVRAVLLSKTLELRAWLSEQDRKRPSVLLALDDIERWLARPHDPDERVAPALPPGQPIGTPRQP